jgi:endonuclease/exonuclease/phosphatase family metal-dependent hydrolase
MKVKLTALRRWLAHLVAGLIGLYAVIMLAYTVFALIDRTDISFYEFIRTGYWVALLAVFPAALLALALRRWRTLLLLPLVVIALAYYVPIYLPKIAPPVPADTPRFTLLTYNIQENTRHLDDIEQVIREIDADVVALQVIGDVAGPYFAEALAAAYPHQAVHPEMDIDIYDRRYAKGQAVFSKFPITQADYWTYDDLAYSHGQQRVELEIQGVAVTLYNVHPWPAIDWEHWYGALTFGFPPERDAAHREAVHRLLARLDQETGRVILAGDFNMSDQFIEYGVLTERYGYRDAFREMGVGVGYTYPANAIRGFPPVIRIDYVFHDAHFTTLSARLHHDAGPSDHFPLIVDLAMQSSP